MKRLFIDMDGVLADFDSRWGELYSVSVKESFSSDRWALFIKSGQFETLDPYPGFDEFISYLNEIRHTPDLQVMILGSTGGYEFHGEVQEQKFKWMKSMDIDIPAIFVPGKRFKRYHATHNSMLVDDHVENISEFLEYGGKAHRYIEPKAAILDIDKFICS